MFSLGDSFMPSLWPSNTFWMNVNVHVSLLGYTKLNTKYVIKSSATASTSDLVMPIVWPSAITWNSLHSIMLSPAYVIIGVSMISFSVFSSELVTSSPSGSRRCTGSDSSATHLVASEISLFRMYEFAKSKLVFTSDYLLSPHMNICIFRVPAVLDIPVIISTVFILLCGDYKVH